ncbi:4-phosphoerythronate dehydrogenase [Paraglaciecola arctica]|uniref:4-phosphoerythronate dehydrogenase n=1 Tax=Paraglaciecola arctica TaxID=1128911 RepID=UPI001C0700BD|nr:4-phosphoerythronate dehydrogenase [Paraglaciecola arctica]MBU3004058.1 4-phosphoerythronate dehydrogenase [Paraglaciecola arctica]
MKIYYEDSMPYAAEFFEELGECQVFSHKTVNPEMLADADVLLVRSTTKVNADLLCKNSRLKFVATATAGTDHVDQNYLESRGIPFVSAGGCNAVAVAEYVLSAMVVTANKHNWSLQHKTVGIIGAGHVGTALSERLSVLGIKYKLCDPPLDDAGDPRDFVPMDDIMQCDVITLHVPWIKAGKYQTQGMFDKPRLMQLSEQQLLINACRGEVLDNQAALELFEQGKKLNLVLDVWDNEPDIQLQLIPYITLATAHIAGHTIEGKARGTEMLYVALSELLGKQAHKTLSDYLPKPNVGPFEVDAEQSFVKVASQLILNVYDIAKDDQVFKKQALGPEQFRYIRKHYPIRREFSAIAVNTGNFVDSKAIYALGFLAAK